MSRSREMAGSLLLLAAGSALLLLAAGRPWRPVGLVAGPTSYHQTGVRTGLVLVPGLSTLALLGLAGVLAVIATRGWFRVGAGLVIAAAGGLAAALSWSAPNGSTSLLASGPRTVWPFVAAASASAMALAGLAVAVRGRRWAGMSGRYETPAARTATPEEGARATWEALDRGEDPTES